MSYQFADATKMVSMTNLNPYYEPCTKCGHKPVVAFVLSAGFTTRCLCALCHERHMARIGFLREPDFFVI